MHKLLAKAENVTSVVLQSAGSSLACASVVTFNQGYYVNLTLYLNENGGNDQTAAVSIFFNFVSNSKFTLTLNQNVTLVAQPLINQYSPPTSTLPSTTTATASLSSLLLLLLLLFFNVHYFTFRYYIIYILYTILFFM